MESPVLTSDRDTPESPLSRESPASMSDSSSGMSSMSGRPASAPIPGYPQTVTTKVKATAKLTFEVHGPFRDRDRDHSSSGVSASGAGGGRRSVAKDNRKNKPTSSYH